MVENPIFTHDFLARSHAPAFSLFAPLTAPAEQSHQGMMVLGSNLEFSNWHFVKENLWSRATSVIMIAERKYLVGVQIAKLLKRETFNLYRSMKVKGIEVVRATSEQVEHLMRCGAVKRGTRSVTLVAYDAAISFVNGTLYFHFRCRSCADCSVIGELHRSGGSPPRREAKKRDSPSISDDYDEEPAQLMAPAEGPAFKRNRANSRIFEDGVSIEDILVSLSRKPIFSHRLTDSGNNTDESC